MRNAIIRAALIVWTLAAALAIFGGLLFGSKVAHAANGQVVIIINKDGSHSLCIPTGTNLCIPLPDSSSK